MTAMFSLNSKDHEALFQCKCIFGTAQDCYEWKVKFMFLASKIKVEVNLSFVLVFFLHLFSGCSWYPGISSCWEPTLWRVGWPFQKGGSVCRLNHKARGKSLLGDCAGGKLIKAAALSVLPISPFLPGIARWVILAAVCVCVVWCVCSLSGEVVQRGSSRWHTSYVKYSPTVSGKWSAHSQPSSGRQLAWVIPIHHQVSTVLFCVTVTRCSQFPRLWIHLTFLPETILNALPFP